MDGSQQPCNIANRRIKRRLDRTVRLGDTLDQLMDNRISPQQARFSAVAELWSQLLPADLCQHCKIADISAGQLKVLVDLPSYMHELRLCSSELLKEMQRQCPRAQIKKIKLVIG
jgi:predicted nucleic acid-binding Zn ribbon protein